MHLSDLAIEILEKKTHKLGDYVFTSAGTRPFENFTRGTKEIKRLIKEQKGLKPRHWRTHDLRRTFASGLARLGIAPHVTEKILNHRSGIISGVAAVYNRYDYAKESGQAMADWSNHVRVILDNLNS